MSDEIFTDKSKRVDEDELLFDEDVTTDMAKRSLKTDYFMERLEEAAIKINLEIQEYIGFLGLDIGRKLNVEKILNYILYLDEEY